MDAETRERLLNQLRESIPKKQIIENAPMSRYTTLRLGGPAELLVEIATPDQLTAAYQAAEALHVPVLPLGNGSNLLVRDGGVRGVVLHLGDLFASVSEPAPLPDGRFALSAQAGATLQKVCNVAADYALTGLEFASGIPGTVGGAVYMNAGAYGGEMKDVVTTVTAIDAAGSVVAFEGDALRFGYRTSAFNQENSGLAVTSVTICLRPGDEDTIRATMREFSSRRREKQPISVPSCGSTFKRPEGQFAGTLIDECGLKGLRIGGASVSELHAGFLVNDEGGTAADFLALIAQVQRVVWEQKGVMLQPEVRIVGEETLVTLA
ncbi:MAG: UDP-N-acetylmuramate dehydrogenase [Clostridia bacterium]